ncbi:MAG: hypothetical protein AAGC55_33535, partial [Myxococcota bacterium]
MSTNARFEGGPALVTILFGLGLALGTGIGCGSGAGAGDETGPEPPAQVIAVAWALSPISAADGSVTATRVSLALTNEVGATEVRSITEVPGTCTERALGPGAQHEGVIALTCGLS